MPPRAGQPWMYGFLDLCLLSLLAERRDYGLGLAQRLAEAGLGEVPGGTLYPALLRLESQGYVRATSETSPSGPPRRYFALTRAGDDAGAELRRRWSGFRAGIDAVTGADRRTAETPDGSAVR
jgi:PadR family transcriptional regulator PadR